MERVHLHQVTWSRFPFNSLARMLRFLFFGFASFFPVVDHPYRMHIHYDHLDTASLKKKGAADNAEEHGHLEVDHRAS